MLKIIEFFTLQEQRRRNEATLQNLQECLRDMNRLRNATVSAHTEAAELLEKSSDIMADFGAQVIQIADILRKNPGLEEAANQLAASAWDFDGVSRLRDMAQHMREVEADLTGFRVPALSQVVNE